MSERFFEDWCQTCRQLRHIHHTCSRPDARQAAVKKPLANTTTYAFRQTPGEGDEKIQAA